MEPSKLDNVLDDIHNHFLFLFDRGFRIQHTEFRNGATWVVTLRSDELNVHIRSDPLEIALAVTDNEDKNRLELFEIVYAASNKKEFIGVYEDQGEYKDAANYRVDQFQRLARILQRYLDEITAFFTAKPAHGFERLQSLRMEARELYRKALNEKLSRMNLP